MPEGVPIYGQALVELRHVRRMTQDDLADACAVAGWRVPRELISAYERGKKSPTPQNLDAIAKALDLSDVEMRALVHTPTLDAATANGNAGEEDKADRRTAGKVIAVGGLSLVLAPSEALERVVTHGDRPIDAGLIAAHEDVAGTLAQAYVTGDNRSILPLMTSHADSVLRLLDRSCGVSHRSRLEALAVAESARAGARIFHGGDRLAARKYLATAADVAGASGSATLSAQALGKLSILHSSAYDRHGAGSRRALDLLDQAAVFAAKADRFTRGWVAAWRAEEAIAARDVRPCRQSLETADRALEGVPVDKDAFGPVGPLTYGVPGQLQALRGLASALNGEFDAAQQQLAEAMRSTETTHQQVILLTQRASIRIHADNPEGACEALSAALGLALGESYTMGVERIRGVRARFPTTPTDWAQLPCVKEFDEQLNVAVASLQHKR